MRRISAAAAGGAVGGAAVVTSAAVSSWRPVGWWVAPAILLLGLPAAVAAATWVTTRAVDRAGPAWPTARLAGVGAPVLAVFTQFVVIAAIGPGSMGAQQAAAVIIGAALAGALAARFTTPEPDDEVGAGA